MAHDNQRALIIGEHLFEKIKRFEIKIIGGLIKHQEIGRISKCQGE